MRDNVSDLKKHIGFWMRIVSNNVSLAFARKLESSGVTVAEWVVLREMYGCDGVIAPSHIAELTNLTRGAVSKLIERLINKNLVSREFSAEDGRYQEIKLTKQAKALVPKLAVLADQNDNEFFSVLSATERKTLTEILKKTAHKNNLTKLPTE